MSEPPEPLILSASPSWRSFGARPLSVAEIDAHPDCDRIWATINELRDRYHEGFEAGAREAEEGAEEQLEDVKNETCDRLKATAEEIAALLKGLGEEIETL